MARHWTALAIAGAIAVPFIASSTGLPAFLASSLDGPKAQDAGMDATQTAAGADAAANGAAGAIDVVWPIHEVLRFDVSSAWVLAHWPRVSASLANLDLQGYRVPLVTGTRPTDIAGSLTYYFDAEQRVKRITFRGTTGDPRELVTWLHTQHQFERATHAQPRVHLYEVKKFGRPISRLTITPTAIVEASAPLARFEVDLIMERPG